MKHLFLFIANFFKWLFGRASNDQPQSTTTTPKPVIVRIRPIHNNRKQTPFRKVQAVADEKGNTKFIRFYKHFVPRKLNK